MFCLSCDTQHKGLNLDNPICPSCGCDNSYVLSLIAEDERNGITDDDYDEEELEVDFKTAQACAKRCIVLYALVSTAWGDDRRKVVEWLKAENLWDEVSAQEASFFESEQPSEQAVIDATWRVEALGFLLWSLGKVDSAEDLSQACNRQQVKAVGDFYLGSTQAFIDSATLLRKGVIDELREEILDAHWSIRDARIHDRALPENLEPGVVMERHHAANWLTGYCDELWDHITTDT